MTKITWSMLAVLLALGACSRNAEEAAPTGAQTEAESPAGQSVPAAGAEPIDPPSETTAPVGSADGEAVEAATVSTSAVAAAIAASTPAPPSGDLRNWKEGVHFTSYPVAQPVGTPPGEIEVIEGFWYGCPHCYELESQLEVFERDKPEWIKVRRVPVIWNEITREDARLFYTIDSLGLTSKLHHDVYREIHKNGRPLTVIRGGRVDLAATEKAARAFLTARGVSAEDFARHYRSFSAENKLRQAENLARRFLLTHTPMVVVQGKYLTDVEMAGGREKLFRLVNDLAARERGAS